MRAMRVASIVGAIAFFASTTRAADTPTRSFEGQAGFGYRRLYDVSIVGGEAAAGIHVRYPSFDVCGSLGFFYGRSREGLPVLDGGLQTEYRVRSDRFWFGIGFELGLLRIVRATEGVGIYSGTVMLDAALGIDLFTHADTAIGVVLRARGGVASGRDAVTPFYAPTLGLYVRL